MNHTSVSALSLLAPLGLATAMTQSAPSAPPPPLCGAGDARQNACADPLQIGTCDFVPLTGDASLGFYCIYSGRRIVTPNRTVTENVGMFLFELTRQDGRARALLFGMGFGDDPHAVLGAARDMLLVDQVLRACMGFEPTSTTVDFLVPHGHFDHVNDAAPRALAALGYQIGAIDYHVADQAFVLACGWTTAALDLAPNLRALTARGTCGAEIASYASPLGRLWVTHRAGHTPGSVDLIVDVQDDPARRVAVLGSSPGGACQSAVPGVRLRVLPHGNVVLNGSGACP